MNRKRIGIYFALAFLIWAWAVWNPVHSRSIQLVLAISFAAMAVGAFSLVPKSVRTKLIVSTALGISILGGAILFLKDDPDRAALRATLVSELERQEGRDYVWGGEGWAGVDCSGLPRRAFRLACVHRGLGGHSPFLGKLAIENWLFDASARAMKDEYRDSTYRLGLTANSIRELDHQPLKPGDMAVTTNGVHMLAYLGDDRWIQADPGVLEVTVEDASNSTNPWMNTPVEIIRWSVLEDTP